MRRDKFLFHEIHPLNLSPTNWISSTILAHLLPHILSHQHSTKVYQITLFMQYLIKIPVWNKNKWPLLPPFRAASHLFYLISLIIALSHCHYVTCSSAPCMCVCHRRFHQSSVLMPIFFFSITPISLQLPINTVADTYAVTVTPTVYVCQPAPYAMPISALYLPYPYKSQFQHAATTLVLALRVATINVATISLSVRHSPYHTLSNIIQKTSFSYIIPMFIQAGLRWNHLWKPAET